MLFAPLLTNQNPLSVTMPQQPKQPKQWVDVKYEDSEDSEDEQDKQQAELAYQIHQMQRGEQLRRREEAWHQQQLAHRVAAEEMYNASLERAAHVHAVIVATDKLFGAFAVFMKAMVNLLVDKYVFCMLVLLLATICALDCMQAEYHATKPTPGLFVWYIEMVVLTCTFVMLSVCIALKAK